MWTWVHLDNFIFKEYYF